MVYVEMMKMKKIARFLGILALASNCSSPEDSFVSSVGTPNGGYSGREGISGQGGDGNLGGNAGSGIVAGAGGESGSTLGQGGATGGGSGSSVAGQGGSVCTPSHWKPISKSPIDENRTRITSSTDGKTVLFAGGATFVFDGPSQPHPDSAIYDPSSDKWQSYGFFDDSNSGYASKYGNDSRYAHLGSNSLWVTDGQEWKEVAKNIGLEFLHGGKMFFVGERLVLWGFLGGNLKIFKYGEISGTLEEVGKSKKISSLNEAASAMSDDGKLLLWGGENEQGKLMGKGYLYDLMSDTWLSLPDAPIPPRKGSLAAWVGDRFMIWGGFANSAEQEPGGATFSPQENTWKTVPDNGAQLKARSIHWTGKKILFWADKNSFFYTPEGGAWEKMSNCGAPEKNSGAAEWTVSGLVVWGDGNQGYLYPSE